MASHQDEKTKKIRAGSRTVSITNPDKVLFPKQGITKLEVALYQKKIAPFALPYMRDRPLNMLRYPDGIGKQGFFQQEIGEHFPKWIDRVKVKKENGSVTHVVCNNAETMVYLAQEASIESHIWLSRKDKLDYPDRMVFDLDPGRGNYKQARFAALRLKEILDSQKLQSLVMTTGSEGYHVIVPIKRRGRNFDEVRKLARQISGQLADRHKDSLTTEQRKNNRRGRVYIDTNRNAYGQTSVAPYSVRAKKKAPIATPLTWQEFRKRQIAPQKYHIKNIFQRLSRKGNAWQGIEKQRVSLKNRP